jgi:hypothetical protein
MRRTHALLTLAAAAAAIAGCDRSDRGEGNNLAALDSQLVGNDVDPALTSALADQIAVDPELANQSNRNAVKTAPTPTQAQYPAPAPAPAQAGGQPARAAGAASGGEAQAAAAATGPGGCALNGPFDYNASWANRLPEAFPIFPGGRVTDAAGYDRGACRMRAVTFTAGAEWRRVVGWYRDQAVRSGYSADEQVRGADHVLAGSKGESAYYLIVTPKGGASEVALIANAGR